MFFPEGQVRVFLFGEPVDMRKSFTGLYALAKHRLPRDPLSGYLFVFINRRGDYLMGPHRLLPVGQAPGARPVRLGLASSTDPATGLDGLEAAA